MALFYFQCPFDCPTCCRYTEYTVSEVLAACTDTPIGVKISFLPEPSGLRSFFLVKHLDSIFPLRKSVYIDMRFVDCGYYPLFHKQCRFYTNKIKERNDGKCMKSRPLACKARPLDISLPPSRQGDVLDFAKNTLGCLGLSEKHGKKIIQTGLFGTKLLGERGAAYALLLANRRRNVALYEAMAESVLEYFENDWDVIHSGMSRNTFYLLPFTLFLRAACETDRISEEEALLHVREQKKCLTDDIHAFLAEYGDKKCFAEVTRPDSEKYTPDRGTYLRRFQDWLDLYAQTEKKLEERVHSSSLA